MTTDIKPCLEWVIVEIAALFKHLRGPESKPGTEGCLEYVPAKNLTNRKKFRAEAELIWMLSVERKMPVVWFTKRNTPSDLLLNLMALRCQLTKELILNERTLTAEQLSRFIKVYDRLSVAPLKLCEVGRARDFNEAVLELAMNGEFTHVVCDWSWVKQESRFMANISPNAVVSFLSPESQHNNIPVHAGRS